MHISVGIYVFNVKQDKTSVQLTSTKYSVAIILNARGNNDFNYKLNYKLK